MKTKLTIAVAALLLSFACKGQMATPLPSSPDTLKEFRFLRKGEPMPFDSGIAVSYRQYVFLEISSIQDKAEQNTDSGLKALPEVVYVKTEVRRKGDGNKLTWSTLGGLAGIILGVTIGALSSR